MSGSSVRLADSLPVWLRVAALSFGGPAGQIGVMHRIVVDEKRWIDEPRFLHALSFCTVLPGPEAQQLATYLGWLLQGTWGGVLAGGLFVLPGFVALMALSWIYTLYGRLGSVEALFFGLKAAVFAIVLQALWRLSRRALPRRGLRVLALAAFLLIFVAGVPFPLIVIGAALIGFLRRASWAPPLDPNPERLPARRGNTVACLVAALLWLVPVLAITVLFGTDGTFGRIALFFSKVAVVSFGGAYAVLAYVAQQGVEHYGWLRPGEMLDGLGMAETTPGPLIMVVQFVGFMAAYRAPEGLPPLLAGTLGGVLTTWVTFMPCFLWIFLGAPFVERLRANRALAGALAAITAAVVGVILNLAVWFGLHLWFGVLHRVPLLGLEVPVLASWDKWALLLSALALLLTFRFKVGMGAVLSLSAALGLLLHVCGVSG